MAVIVTNIFLPHLNCGQDKTPQLAWSELLLCPAGSGEMEVMGCDSFIPSSKMTPRGLKFLFICQLAHLLLCAENQEDKPDGKER